MEVNKCITKGDKLKLALASSNGRSRNSKWNSVFPLRKMSSLLPNKYLGKLKSKQNGKNGKNDQRIE
jgi:hypothetical protein